jgi:spore photoproduct lyase
MSRWTPEEIILHDSVKEDPVTASFLAQCPGVPVKVVTDGNPKTVVAASGVLSRSGPSMLDKILAGKGVVYLAPTSNDIVDVFAMPDDRVVCPHFDRLKLASNGCFYQCDWCYLKLTYRAAFPFITIKTQYDKVKEQVHRRLSQTKAPVIFNTGELADSLSMEHLTRAAREFIPWFGHSKNGYLFMLTKSDSVDQILDSPHNAHTIIAFSMNDEKVSRKFEIGAPPFERRLEAARKVEEAGYPLRIRLDPIVPIEGWREAYSETIKRIFQRISPERVTLGTLRFEEGFYNMRNTILTTGPDLPKLMEDMAPMFPPKRLKGLKRPRSGKYSFPQRQRVKIFRFAMKEIRKYSDCRIALCKESPGVWKKLGLPLSKCSCVCQLD